MQGSYNELAKTFTAGSAGTDTDSLLVYDSEAATGAGNVRMEAVVILGLNASLASDWGGILTVA